MRVTETVEKLPQFPKCTVRGHDHCLVYIETIVQDGTGTKGYLIECPNETYRFLYIPDAYERTGKMPRMRRPRWGW